MHEFSHATLTIQATPKYLHNSESHETGSRKLGGKRGVPEGDHMMVVPFLGYSRVEGDRQGDPTTLASAILSYRPSNSPEALVPAEPSPWVGSPRRKLCKSHEPQFDLLYIQLVAPCPLRVIF